MKIVLKKLSFAIGILFCCMNVLCEGIEEPGIDVNYCDDQVIIDESLFETLQSSNFDFVSAEIIDDCLFIDMGASGCDGNTWEFALVDSGAIAESSPEQRYLKFQLINQEACLAFLQETISFDLTPIQINGSNEIILNIEGYESSLNYKY